MIYSLENVRHCYGTRTVLDIPSLHIAEGEILAVVGPSGAGKSTLLRLLALLEIPTSGSIHAGAIARDITMVFQRPLLLSRTVRANIGYGLTVRGQKKVDEQVSTMLDYLSLRPVADARPYTLSGGEIQRVAIARAMILEPRVLLLDEPTANLDPYNVGLIEQFLLERQRGATIVIVTHNIFQARRLAQRVALLYNGELVEVAPTEQFFSAPNDPRTRDFIAGKLIY